MSFDNLCKESKHRVAKIRWSPTRGMKETVNYLTYLVALLFFRQQIASLKL